MLKLEPREAARVLLPPCDRAEADPVVVDAVATMRRWRHYDV